MKHQLIYGTAWKRDDTASYVLAAIRAGFRAFDTACQPKHYREELVGEGIRRAFEEGVLTDREEIWIQTKFTRPSAHDPDNCPYDLNASIEEQVHQSVQTSLANLRHRRSNSSNSSNADPVYLDALLLHSPYPDVDDTLRAWRALSRYVPDRVRALGVCNISQGNLARLYEAADARVKPAIVQNRFHAETGWEISQRRFCAERGICWQAHKVLKQKEEMLASEVVGEVVAVAVDVGGGGGGIGFSRQVAVYLLVLSLGGEMAVLNGTKNEEHMREDVEALARFRAWRAEDGNERRWDELVGRFKELIGQS